jgi:acyl-homoserine lactone acylase PvdQ
MVRAVVLVAAFALLAAACSGDDDEEAGGGDGPGGTGTSVAAEDRATEDTARYVLPPGNYGGIPTGDNSLDQLPLYDGLTPLRGDIDEDDLEEHYLPQDFAPIEPTTVEETPREGVEIVYDAYGIPHVTGETRADVAYGAGWVTARDRTLLIQLALGPARAAVVDVPGIDAFSLVTSGQTFEPSEAAEALVSEQWDLLVEEYGEEGEEIRADAEAGSEGANAWFESQGIETRVTPNDVLATTAFIGSIFGAGGGGEVDNARLLAELQAGLGEAEGTAAWEDAMFSDDPEAPTTLDEAFEYGALTGGDVTGSVPIDAGSVVPLDAVPDGPPDPEVEDLGEAAGAAAGAATSAGVDTPGQVDPTAAPPDREASNWLVVSPERSATGATQAVMGPQLGYYYPGIVQQIHLKGPDFEAQGAAVPGLNMYMLIGRTADYAWSLTSAGHDVRDVFAEELCEPDGGEPTVESDHYVFEGECTPMEQFDAGTLNGNPVVYPRTVHGPVIGTATSEGRPVALARQRSTFGRDGLNLVALKQMTEGDAATPEDFFEVANRFEFTFNWGYASRDATAFFSSGRLPVRAEGLDRRLPTSGTGDYEWQGFLELDEHPHGTTGPDGLLLNWNNQAAPGFMHGDGEGTGPYHRVQLFDQWPDATRLTDVVGVMNRAATEDVRSPVWPLVSEVLAGGEAPGELEAEVLALLDEWVADDAPRLDADDDGTFDHAGPTILDALWEPMVRAVLEPVYGDQLEALDRVRPLDQIGASFLHKDLRSLLGEDVEAPLANAYCGAGDLEACRAALWAVVAEQAAALEAEYGPDPATWLAEGDRTTFVPELIPDDFRRTNRPTYQQILELVGR